MIHTAQHDHMIDLLLQSYKHQTTINSVDTVVTTTLPIIAHQLTEHLNKEHSICWQQYLSCTLTTCCTSVEQRLIDEGRRVRCSSSALLQARL